MSSDPTTIAVYDTKFADYVALEDSEWRNPSLDRFVEMLPEGAYVLDLGCGPGKTAAFLQKAGFTVDATDASAAMVKVAAENYGIPVRHATFDDIDGQDKYGGIWANFSLLHAPKSRMPSHLTALHKALKPDGVLHIGMKLGSGERRDRLDRFYAYYSQTELEDLLTDAGFHTLNATFGSGTGLDGSRSDWIVMTAHA